ncbi:hypothetical protein [Streptomyces sp. NEAU-H3]|uniref:hypothetical protein n=1 Tax=Streptomyces sp. NEAU-H3 TaxID=2720636 RepID=UPI00143B496B|nr:hypothetical protein [Streptomyces sp. NEAU-H3]NJA59173.1 hypothetical protein [Streptomyces sp. NEAU-H3]
MNDFQPMTVLNETATADRPWLASLVGIHDANTITLDLTKFVAGVHYESGNLLQPRNVLKSGIPLGLNDTTGLYEPYAGPTSEAQTVTVTGSPTGGTYTLTFSGQTTAGIPYNATPAQVRAALEALSNVNPGDVVVSGGPHPGTPVIVTFAGQYLGDDVTQMTASATNLTGGASPAVTVTTSTAGGAAGASNGTQKLAGFLATESLFAPGSTKTSGALLWYGEVFAAKCPIPFDPANVTATRPGVSIHYR